MAVPGRNRTLFRCVFRSHCCVRSTLVWSFRYGRGSYALGKLINTCHVYTVRISPTLNGSSALQRFERSNASEIRNGIMFDFYPGLHIYSITCIMSNVYNYPSLPSSSCSMYNVYNMHKYTHIRQPICICNSPCEITNLTRAINPKLHC